MKITKHMRRLECSYAYCTWTSSASEVRLDDGSLMTDYRRHVDVAHTRPPTVVEETVELEV